MANIKKKRPGRPALEENKDSHKFSTRFPITLWKRILKAAKKNNIKPSLWIRRATEEKLDRDD